VAGAQRARGAVVDGGLTGAHGPDSRCGASSFYPKTFMLFGDAKKMLEKLVGEVRRLD
jgi:hypothetical protein